MEYIKENINLANVCSEPFKGFLDRDDETDLLKKCETEESIKMSLAIENGDEEFDSDLVPFIKEEPIGIWEHNSMDLDNLDDESEREHLDELDFNHGFTDWIGNSADDNCNDHQQFLIDPMPAEFIKLEKIEEPEFDSSHSDNLLQDSLWIDCPPKKLEDSTQKEVVIVKKEPTVLSCQICKKIFRERMFLYNHLKEFHHCNIIFECDTCQKIFLNKTSLITHLNTHSKRKNVVKKSESDDSESDESIDVPQTVVSCEICGKHFVEKIYLYNHLKAYHNCNVIFECDTCRQIFLNDKSLLLHLETHTKKNKRNKQFRCDICSKKFSWQINLDQHRLKHYFERNYVCNVCSKRFSQESELELHKVCHSSDGLLQCNVCHRKFARQCNLVQHKRVHNRTFAPKY